MNYFALLDVPVSFFPDKQLVRKNYLRLSREYHPDLQSDGSSETLQERLRMSSHLNEAYRVFSSFEDTVAYVLKSKGLLNEGEKPVLPPDFLMEMMEINEALMDARIEGDEPAISNCIKEVETREKQLMEEWASLCQEYDSRQDATLLSAIRDCYFKHRYLIRLKEQTG